MPFNSKKSDSKGFYKGNSLFENIYLVSFFIIICGYYLFYDSRALMIGSTFIGILGSVTFFIHKIKFSKVRAPINTIWYFIFFALAELSSFWAFSPEIASRQGLVFMITMLIVGFGLSQYATTSAEVEKVIFVFVYAATVISVVQLIFTPVSSWTAGYFGSAVGSNNSNTFGFISLTSCIMSYYLAYMKGHKKHYFFVIFFLFMCLLTSSRKAIIMSLVGIVLLTLFAFKKRNHLIHFIIMSAGAGLAFVLFLNVDFFYNLIGYRFVGFLESFFNSEENMGYGGSLALRHTFIEYAKILFKEKPLLGQGFANYTDIVISEFYSSGSYAHNNYWEILADLGAVGFIVYYWFYVFLFIAAVVQIARNPQNRLAILGFTFLISEIVLEWGVVSMISFFPQMLICMSYICITCSVSNRKFHYSPKANKR